MWLVEVAWPALEFKSCFLFLVPASSYKNPEHEGIKKFSSYSSHLFLSGMKFLSFATNSAGFLVYCSLALKVARLVGGVRYLLLMLYLGVFHQSLHSCRSMGRIFLNFLFLDPIKCSHFSDKFSVKTNEKEPNFWRRSWFSLYILLSISL